MVNYHIRDGKLGKDGMFFENESLTVSAAFPDFFYVENDDRSTGICVQKAAHNLTTGMRVHVTGQMATNQNSERYIEASEVIQIGVGSVSPLGMSNMLIGGGDLSYDAENGTGQAGVYGWRHIKQTDGSYKIEWLKSTGLNNIGLLVMTWGKVTAVGVDYLYIDDGSALNDKTENGTGVRVVCDPTGHSIGDFMLVTGISSCLKTASGDIVPQILMR
jgi:hypothetical protein